MFEPQAYEASTTVDSAVQHNAVCNCGQHSGTTINAYACMPHARITIHAHCI